MQCEVRDAGSDEIVHYTDVNGEWIADKNELVYMDFSKRFLLCCRLRLTDVNRAQAKHWLVCAPALP